MKDNVDEEEDKVETRKEEMDEGKDEDEEDEEAINTPIKEPRIFERKIIVSQPQIND